MRQEFCCKTGEVINKYEFDKEEIDQTLVAKWRGEDSQDELSINDLEEWFNKQLLKEVYKEHGRPVPEYRLDAEYEVLADLDVAEHQRAELVSELAADGIDADRIFNDFVSYSTIYRHFQDCLGVEKNPDKDNTSTEWERDGIEFAKEQFHDRVTKSFRNLSNKDRMVGWEDAELQFSAHLRCSYCPIRVPIETVIDRGFVCATHNDLEAAPDVTPGQAVASFLA